MSDEDYYDDVEVEDNHTRNLRERQANNKAKTANSQAEKRIRKLTEGIKFLSDFDPEKSTRERRKLTRKCYTGSKSNHLYDEKGKYRSTGADVCDCLASGCPGCHFPCHSCKSPKCGTNCRVNRKWAFEMIEHDGKDLVITNKNIDAK